MVSFNLRATGILVLLASVFPGQSLAATCTTANAAAAPEWYNKIMETAKGIASSAGSAAGGAVNLGAINSRVNDAMVSNAVKYRKRAVEELSCTGDEICIKYENEPYCASQKSQTTRDSSLVTYSLATGDYTLPDGTKGNLLFSPGPLASFIESQPTKAAGGGGAGAAAATTTAASAGGGNAASGNGKSSAEGMVGAGMGAVVVAVVGAIVGAVMV